MKNQPSNTSQERVRSACLPRQFSADGLVEPGPWAWLPHAAAIIGSLLKEIFDESAYSRFLERNRIASSPTAYAAFREENDDFKARRPKCC